MSNTPVTENIIGREARFAVHCPTPRGGGDDIHVVKEIVHNADGTQTPNFRFIPNYKFPFYVTKKGLQNHKDKKEWERIENVNTFKTTQTDLVYNIQKALDVFGGQGRLRQLGRSPYLYGTDILSTTRIKHQYQQKWPQLVTPFTVACFDVETDVVHGTGEIIMATLSFGSRVVTVIDRKFLSGFTDVERQLRQTSDKYLGDVTSRRGINWEIVLADGPADVVVKCFAKAHEWKPDIVAIWNINFDMPKVLDALARANIDPKDVFSDPSVPYAYRFFKYKVGQGQKVTAAGKTTPKDPHEQWHTVFAPCSFYFIDAMCAYKQIRTGEQEEQSYGLDAILRKHGVGGKLEFKEAEGLTRIEWHQFMQSTHKLEYVIYNKWDCISMEELDEATNDLRFQLPLFSGDSDFSHFSSQPRRAVDKLHYFCLDNGRVIGSTSDEMETAFDSMTLDLRGWIVTLPAHLVVDNGLCIIKGMPWLRTNIRAHVGDLDVSASYPNGGAVMNISKETTRKELCGIVGVPEQVQRMQGINLSGGHTNATEFCVAMYGLPDFDQLLEAFEEEIAQESNTVTVNIAEIYQQETEAA